MKKNEQYWLDLYNSGLIEIDFKNGIVYSYLNYGHKYELAQEQKDPKKYKRSSAGPSRKERYHILLHRLIWICYYGDIPEKIKINHKNGIKNDNRIENLELATKSENAIHSRRVLGNKGGCLRFEQHNLAKLKWEDVNYIRKTYVKGIVSMKSLAEKYNVSIPTVADVLKYRHWNSTYKENS